MWANEELGAVLVSRAPQLIQGDVDHAHIPFYYANWLPDLATYFPSS